MLGDVKNGGFDIGKTSPDGMDQVKSQVTLQKLSFSLTPLLTALASYSISIIFLFLEIDRLLFPLSIQRSSVIRPNQNRNL